MSEKAPEHHNAPERIWLGLRGKSWEWDGSWSPRPFPINEDIVVEQYVRADLLATVRKEERKAAFKEAVAIVTSKRSKWSQEGAPSDRLIGADYILEALERAAATDKEKE